MCRLIHVHVKSNWLQEAVTIKIEAIGLDDFWDPAVFDRLRYYPFIFLFNSHFQSISIDFRRLGAILYSDLVSRRVSSRWRSPNQSGD